MTTSSSDKERLFVAISLPKYFRKRIADRTYEIQQVLLNMGINDNVRYEPVENHHISLHFLGDTLGSDIPDLITIIAEIAKKFEPIRITTEAPSYFSDKDDMPFALHHRVQNNSELTQLHHTVSAATTNDAKSYEYTPHITYGRFPKDLDRDSREEIINVVDSLGFESLYPVELAQMGLFSSHRIFVNGDPNRRKAYYKRLKKFVLTTTNYDEQ